MPFLYYNRIIVNITQVTKERICLTKGKQDYQRIEHSSYNPYCMEFNLVMDGAVLKTGWYWSSYFTVLPTLKLVTHEPSAEGHAAHGIV